MLSRLQTLADPGARPNAQSAPRLLIVDDVADNRIVLARRLQRRGFETVEASGGHEALRCVEEQSFDVVLLDMMMPEIDGLEVLEHIRRRFSAGVLPVIMVTAKTQSDDVAEALNAGANDYITKPVDFTVALSRINAQIARRRSELQSHDAQLALNQAKTSLEAKVADRSAKLIAAQATIIEESARRVESEGKVEYLAHHDSLTGLANRFTFDQRLRAKSASPAPRSAWRCGRRLWPRDWFSPGSGRPARRGSASPSGAGPPGR